MGRVARPAMTDRALGEIVDRVLERAAKGEVPGVTFVPSGVQASVARDGHVEAEACRGVDAAGAPITRASRFRIASQGKPVVALMALRLVEHEHIGLDTPVWPWLGSWTPNESQVAGFDLAGVTLRSLLSHTAGWSVHGFPTRPASESAVSPSQCQLLEGAAGTDYAVRLLHQPGTRTLYSAAGYAIADLVIEQAAGVDFEQALRELIVGPLKLERLSSLLPHELPTPIVRGFRSASEEAQDAYFLCRSASGMTGNATDLARVYSAVCADASRSAPERACLLGSSLAFEAVRAHRVDDSPHPFGLGFALDKTGDLRTARHAGFGDGFAGVTEGMVDLGIAVSVQVTASAPVGKIVARRICARVMEAITGQARHSGADAS